MAFYRHWLEAFPDARLEPDAIHVTDDLTVEHGVFTGTHDGVARTGRSVSLQYIQLLRYRDDKLISMMLMFDRLAMLEQLGLARDADRPLASGAPPIPFLTLDAQPAAASNHAAGQIPPVPGITARARGGTPTRLPDCRLTGRDRATSASGAAR
jgi:hypothetical protein